MEIESVHLCRELLGSLHGSHHNHLQSKLHAMDGVKDLVFVALGDTDFVGKSRKGALLARQGGAVVVVKIREVAAPRQLSKHSQRARAPQAEPNDMMGLLTRPIWGCLC